MASFLSTQVNPHVTLIGQAPTTMVETFSFALAAQTINSGDTITLCQIPIFSSILEICIASTVTLGATQTFSLGTTTSTAQFLAAGSTAFQAAGFTHLIPGDTAPVAGSMPSTRFTTQTVATLPAGLVLNPTSTVADYLVLTAGVNAVAAGTGTLKGYMLYTLNTVS